MLGTAATIGSLKPKIFLTQDFENWQRTEQASVLAHEIAHIHHRDFTANIVSQICTSLHFFNPMVHWLVRQMRLHQEVAADQIAAQITLGQKDYARMLATLALRQDDQSNLRLASMFIPQEDSFIRRIEMLRNTKHGSIKRFRSLIPAFAFVVAAAVCGVRAPASNAVTNSPALAASEFSQEKATEFLTDYISDRPDQVAVFVRPARLYKSGVVEELLKLEPFKSGIQQLDKMFEGDTGIGTSHIDQLVQVTSFAEDEQLDRCYSIARTFEDNLTNFKALGEIMGQSKSFPIEIKRIDPISPMRHGLILDERTILWCFTEKGIELAKSMDKQSAKRATWYKKFKKVAKKPLVVVGGRELIAWSKGSMSAVLNGEQIDLFARCQTVVVAADVDRKITCRAALGFLSQADAKAAEAAISDIKSSLEKLLWGAASSPNEPTKSLGKSALESLKTLETKVALNTLELKSTFELDIKAIKSVAGEIRKAAAKTQGMNNQRQLGLALLNYESAYGHFPEAVIRHESGQVHSWRVAILPFLEQGELYKKYRFSEPWNSEHNLAVTKIMPETYKHPLSESETNTNYFAVVGPETLFAEGKKMKFDDVTDASHNTVLVVEALRDCHWAKPEDISFDEAARVETLGGLNENTFTVTRVDSSTHQLPNEIPPLIFRSFLTIAGDEEFLLSEYFNFRQ